MFVGKLLAKQDGDVLREGDRAFVQALTETQVAERRHFGAASMKRMPMPSLAAGEETLLMAIA
jgi:hypothetical protein